jgi:hypothetical protein
MFMFGGFQYEALGSRSGDLQELDLDLATLGKGPCSCAIH